MTNKDSEHPIVTIPNIALEDFERAVYAHSYEEAGKLLVTALRRIRCGAEFIGYKTDDATRVTLYTRFAAAVVALFADPHFQISQEGFDNIAAEHAAMDLIFRVSVFGNGDHLLPHVSNGDVKVNTENVRFNDSMALAKFLLVYSLRSNFMLNFDETFGKAPKITLALWVGMLTHLLAVDPVAHGRREYLLGLSHLFEDNDMPDALMSAISDMYMYTSYGTRPDKHAPKALIHKLYRRMLTARGLVPLLPMVKQRKLKQRPTILIAIDWFSSLHAMYRCYAPSIRQLRKRFKLVGMCREASIDEAGKAEFDEWHSIPNDGVVLADVIARIRKINPDIIYYPSLGMALWWVATASIRLAPIQVMTLGHPASSRSPEMDYVVCEETSIGDPALFTEKIVEMPLGSARFVHRADLDEGYALPNRADVSTIHIAIPSMLCKLNAPFLETLQKIKERALRPVVYHFFPNVVSAMLHQTAKEIQAQLPGSFLYERAPYNTYREHLGKCHMQLCTFPFGGTNSNIDAFLLGIPFVAMEGQEPHERFDAQMIRRIGLPEWLIAKSIEEYVAAAVKLIDKPALIQEQSKFLLEHADIEWEFFGEPPAEWKDSTLKAFEMIYEKHEQMQKSKDRVFYTHKGEKHG